MKRNSLGPVFYFGLSLLTIGTLFKIQHWPYGSLIQIAGSLFDAVFFCLLVFEIIASKKATLTFKIVATAIYTLYPIIAYCCLPAIIMVFAVFIGGSVYLQKLRRKVLFTEADMIKKHFDDL